MDEATPEWLTRTLAAGATPREAAANLLFHGTVEPFDGPLVASCWEGLRWFAETPEVAQSYCPESGSEALKTFASYALDDHLVPHHDLDERIMGLMGFDVASMEAERDPRTGRMVSYRLLPGHPTNRDALTFLESMGYVFEGESRWLKTRCLDGGGYEIMPADWIMPGRLFVCERPRGLRLYDLQSIAEGGLSGRQWMRTDVFEEVSASGRWDGIVIDDVHHARRTGHFGHRSIGLFQSTMSRLRMHVIACRHEDLYDIWSRRDGSTTPQFDGLHRLARTGDLRLAA